MERKSVFQGSWYPDDPEVFVTLVSEGRTGNLSPRIAVLPHAGFVYSSRFISQFFQNLPEETERLVIISPSHYFPLAPDELIQATYDSASTPLGPVPVFQLDLHCAQKDCGQMDREHAIEIFLPYAAARGLSTAFLMISHASSADVIDEIASELSILMDSRTALIASSDFTHYGPRFNFLPYGLMDAEEKVRENDLSIASMLCSGNMDKVFPLAVDNTICGIVPAMIASSLASRLGLEGRVMGCSNSNKITKSHDADFVSYCCIWWG